MQCILENAKKKMNGFIPGYKHNSEKKKHLTWGIIWFQFTIKDEFISTLPSELHRTWNRVSFW